MRKACDTVGWSFVTDWHAWWEFGALHLFLQIRIRNTSIYQGHLSHFVMMVVHTEHLRQGESTSRLLFVIGMEYLSRTLALAPTAERERFRYPGLLGVRDWNSTTSFLLVVYCCFARLICSQLVVWWKLSITFQIVQGLIVQFWFKKKIVGRIGSGGTRKLT